MVKICLRCRRPGFNPWVGKLSWRRKWPLIPVFLPGESHGERTLEDYSHPKCQTWQSKFHFHFQDTNKRNPDFLIKTHTSIYISITRSKIHRNLEMNCGVGKDSWVPLTARRSNQPILKEISPEYSLEGLMLKLKLQYFGHLMRRDCLIEKDPDAGKDWRQEEKGKTEDEMAGQHHWLNGHEFERAPGDGDGQGSLACYVYGVAKCWTWLSNWTELMVHIK